MTPIRDPHRKRGYHCSGVLTCKDTGYVLACLATRKKVLATVQENLLRHNHSMIQFVNARNLPFATNQWVNCGVQSLFSRNQQTIALKSLKANSPWNILVVTTAGFCFKHILFTSVPDTRTPGVEDMILPASALAIS